MAECEGKLAELDTVKEAGPNRHMTVPLAWHSRYDAKLSVVSDVQASSVVCQ